MIKPPPPPAAHAHPPAATSTGPRRHADLDAVCDCQLRDRVINVLDGGTDADPLVQAAAAALGWTPGDTPGSWMVILHGRSAGAYATLDGALRAGVNLVIEVCRIASAAIVADRAHGAA